MDIKLPKEYLKMSSERKESLKDWISKNFYSRKTMNKEHTSYGLKHVIQSDNNDYYTNDEFKGGMLEMGFIPDDTRKLNWCFNLSEKSYNETRKRIERERREIYE